MAMQHTLTARETSTKGMPFTNCIHGFRMILRINSDYFHKNSNSVDPCHRDVLFSLRYRLKFEAYFMLQRIESAAVLFYLECALRQNVSEKLTHKQVKKHDGKFDPTF
jgi:hypothetical protein